MKASSLLFALLFTSYCFTSPLFGNATNYTNNGSSSAYNLNSGDTLRVVNGAYRGNLNTFNAGAVVIVSAGATFKPNYINTPSGKILNYGTCEFNSLGTNGGFWFENFNLATVSGDLSLYDGSQQTWNNNVTARMAITGNFYMNNAVFNNYASMVVGGNFSLYTATSNLINKGLLVIGGNFSISNGIVNNKNRVYVNDFNAWGGQVINEGSISPRGSMTFNSGTSYTNQCLLVTSRGFTNYGNFQNNGLLWVGKTGTADDHFYNSGTFTNSNDAVVKTVRFTNYNTLSGGGSYYINGSSYSSGTVGKSGATTDSIKIYDVTRTNAGSFFDVQYGTVHPNAVFRTVALPDTAAITYTGCSSFYRSDLGSILPVEWNYFEAKMVQGNPVLNWSAQHSGEAKFEVERSYDNSNFTAVTTVVSNATKTYSHTDGEAKNYTTVYYRVKATNTNGTIIYTGTKMLKAPSTNTTFSVYPNPVTGPATLIFKAEKNGQLMLRVRNAAGQEIIAKNIMVAAGTNTINLPETATVKSGVYMIEVMDEGTPMASSQFVKL